MATTRMVRLISERTREGEVLWQTVIHIDGQLVDATRLTPNPATAVLDGIELQRRWPHVDSYTEAA